jgi:protein tyrosine phosphatase (PTP) superfamily phosphohydrolase (DUF442 family)
MVDGQQSVVEIRNFYQATDTIATAGQPNAGQLACLGEQRYVAVINLALPDSMHAVADESHIVASQGITYINIPVNFEQPSVQQLQHFFAVMDAYAANKILVHCALNMRVGVFVHRYLTLVKGVDEHAATSPLLKQWLPDMPQPWRKLMALQRNDLARNSN